MNCLHFCDILCAKLEADHAKGAPLGLQRYLPNIRAPGSPVTPGFRVDGGRLNIESPAVFDKPANLVKLFEIAERRDLDVHPVALREATRRARQVTRQNRLFCSL